MTEVPNSVGASLSGCPTAKFGFGVMSVRIVEKYSLHCKKRVTFAARQSDSTRSTAVVLGKPRFDTTGGSTFVLRSAILSKNIWFILMKVVYIKGLGK